MQPAIKTPLKLSDRPFTKEAILKDGENLKNFVDTIHQAVQGLIKVKEADVVLAIGNTGVGKSTMLSSIVFGPKKLRTAKNKKYQIE